MNQTQPKERIRAAYDAVGATYYITYVPTSLFSLEKRRRLELATELLAQVGVQHVLDVGCGPGVGVWQLATRVPGTSVVGVDFAPAMIRFARTHYAQYGAFAVADAERLPFASGAFDGIVALGLLDKFDQLGGVLAEISRVLATGATFVFTYPNQRAIPPTLRRSARAIVRRRSGTPERHFLTLPDLAQLLAQTGFEVQACRYITYGNGRWFFRWSTEVNRRMEAWFGRNGFGRILSHSTIWHVVKDDRSPTLG